MKLLYVEDTPLHIRVMQKIAVMAGFDFMSATTGYEATSMLVHQPDLIIVDIGLPDINGLTLAEQIHHTYASIPIIVVSASGLAEDREHALAVGCVEYISKPFRFMEMLEHVTKYRT